MIDGAWSKYGDCMFSKTFEKEGDERQQSRKKRRNENMSENYGDQKNIEKIELKNKKTRSMKNVKKGYEQDRQRCELGISISNKEQEENDVKKYRDGIPRKDKSEVQQPNEQEYGDQLSTNDEK